MKVILLIGAKGYLGSRIKNDLQSDYTIVSIVRDEFNADKRIFPSSSLEKVFREYEIYAIVYAANIYSSNNIADLIDSNYTFVLTSYKLAQRHNVQLFLNLSTFFIKYREYSYLKEYILTKSQSFDALNILQEEINLKLVQLIIHHMYGPSDKNSKFINSLHSRYLENQKVEMTDGSSVRDFIHVDDVVECVRFILEKADILRNKEILEVGTGVGTSIKELAVTLKKIVESDSELIMNVLPPRRNEIKHAVADITRLIELGWTPSIPLESGLRTL